MGITTRKKQKNFIFFVLAKAGEGISGSDRIFIELARNWSKKYPIKIFTNSEGLQLCKIQKLKGKNLKLISINNNRFEKSFLFNYLFKILKGVYLGLTLGVRHQTSKIIYSSSDFWMDVFPALLFKLRFNQIKWVATWYQTAPNPLRGFVEQRTKSKELRAKTYKISAFLYWFSQILARPLIKKYADKVIVNNEDEKKRFAEHTRRGDTIVLIGAVPLSDIKKYQSSTINHQPSAKRYDAVFQGRFHPQKGVVELIDIWKKVVDKKPDAKLAMIGDGPLMKDVRSKIQDLRLEKNVKLLGYLFDGPNKYSIFHAGKIVVHPAFYDSGGMASAEAMAFGLPAVGFNLKAYESYYPRGMEKVKKGDLDAFAKAVLKLLTNDGARINLGKRAKKMIEKNWSWESRAEELIRKILQ